MGRTYSALLASQKRRHNQPNEEGVNGPRRLQRLQTASTQISDAPPRAQVRSGPKEFSNWELHIKYVALVMTCLLYW